MKLKALCTAFAFACTVGSVFAESHTEKNAAPGQDEMMAKWAAHATPGEAHKRLESMAGSWTMEGKYVMGPGQPETATKATSEGKMILEGRILQQDFQSEMMGQPFTGMSLLGYDNTAKKYVQTWSDTMTTSILVSYGTYDEATKEITFAGDYDDPMGGGKKKFRNVVRITSADSHDFEMYDVGPDGKEYKAFWGTYTRKK